MWSIKEGNMRMKVNLILIIIFSLLAIYSLPAQETNEKEKEPQEDALKLLLNSEINTASRYNQTVREAPASVTVITSEEIERFGLRTLDEILMRVRGFYITNDHNYSYVGVRGFSRPSDYNNRVLVLIDGVSTADNIFGSASIGTEFGVSVEAIERIEIVRGPCSVVYGSSAMLAVINVITKDEKTEKAATATLQAGNLGNIQGGIRAGKAWNNGLGVFFSAYMGSIKGQDYYFEEYDKPETNYGKAENIDHDKFIMVMAKLKYKNLSLKGFLGSREKQIPTGAYDVIFNDPGTKTFDLLDIFELKYSGKISFNKRVTFRGYYGHYFYKGKFPYNLPDYTTLQEDQSRGDWVGIEGQFGWDIRTDNRFLVGVEYKNNLHSGYKWWDEFDMPFDKDYPFEELSLYFQDEYQILKNLSITLGARYDHFSDRGKAISPRAALIYNPSPASALKFLYGNAFRAPNFYEIYYEVTDEAKSNLNIKGEKVHTYETVWEQQIGKYFSSTLCLYYFEMPGLIEQVKDPSDDLLQFRNLDKIIGKGVEAEIKVNLKNGGIGYINYNWQSCRKVNTTVQVTNSPSHILKGGFSLPVLNHFWISVESFYESGRVTLSETKTKPFWLTDVNLLTKPIGKHFRFSFRVKNLFDKEYRTPGGWEHIQPSLVQFGRCFTLKLDYFL